MNLNHLMMCCVGCATKWRTLDQCFLGHLACAAVLASMRTVRHALRANNIQATSYTAGRLVVDLRSMFPRNLLRSCVAAWITGVPFRSCCIRLLRAM